MEETRSLREWLKQFEGQILCLDGGGTKSTLQTMSEQGSVQGGPLNVHDIGYDAVRQTLQGLLGDHDPQKTTIVAGIAGAEREKEHRELSRLLTELGFDRFWLRGDGDLLLDALAPTGLVLIAGTGSHCMGVHDGKRARAGGLGRILGDEGSGYWVGLQAIRAALAAQYGWGEKTLLNELVCDRLSVGTPEELMHPVNSGTLSRRDIANLAPLVLDVSASDPVSALIQSTALDHLSDLVRLTRQQLKANASPLILVGGLFRDPHFTQELVDRVGLEVENLAHRQPIAWAVERAVSD